MENNNENVTNEVTKENENVNNEEKTFTQKELDSIVETRLAKAKKGIPSKEELDAFNSWKEAQKTEQEKREEKDKENAKILEERNNYKKENLLLRKGVNAEDIDYVIYKVSKLEGEFADNLNDFLKNNPKYLGTKETKKETESVVVNTGTAHKEVANNEDKLRKAFGL